jgi:predicted type IV restriction endonuclease
VNRSPQRALWWMYTLGMYYSTQYLFRFGIVEFEVELTVVRGGQVWLVGKLRNGRTVHIRPMYFFESKDEAERAALNMVKAERKRILRLMKRISRLERDEKIKRFLEELNRLESNPEALWKPPTA